MGQLDQSSDGLRPLRLYGVFSSGERVLDWIRGRQADLLRLRRGWRDCLDAALPTWSDLIGSLIRRFRVNRPIRRTRAPRSAHPVYSLWTSPVTSKNDSHRISFSSPPATSSIECLTHLALSRTGPIAGVDVNSRDEQSRAIELWIILIKRARHGSGASRVTIRADRSRSSRRIRTSSGG